jgi:hypothetical protein
LCSDVHSQKNQRQKGAQEWGEPFGGWGLEQLVRTQTSRLKKVPIAKNCWCAWLVRGAKQLQVVV